METITLGDVGAALDASAPGELHVVLTGKSTSRDAGKTLAPLFDRTLAAARDERRAVIIHFERLEYFNSSTIAALVQFIRAAQDRAVVLTVRYDAGQRWQALSFDALKHALRPAQGGAPAVAFAADERREA